MTENEGETEDDGGERNERRQSVGTIEDEQREEGNDHKCNSEQNRVQFRKSRACVLYAGDQSLSLSVDPLDGLPHLFLGDVGVTVFVEYIKRGLLPTQSAKIQHQGTTKF